MACRCCCLGRPALKFGKTAIEEKMVSFGHCPNFIIHTFPRRLSMSNGGQCGAVYSLEGTISICSHVLGTFVHCEISTDAVGGLDSYMRSN